MIPSTPSVSVSVPAMLPTPTRRSHPESKAPLGNEFLGPFCRFAHGVTTRGAVPPSDHLWLLPTFHTDKDWRIIPPIPIASPVIATWCISANPEGVPQECPPTSSINTVSPPVVNKWYDHQPGGFLLLPFKPSSCSGYVSS